MAVPKIANTAFRLKILIKGFKISILKYFKKLYYFFIRTCTLEFGIIRSTLPPSCVASTLHHQNHTLCPKLRITKRKFILPTRKVFENQFWKQKSKKPYFSQCSHTVVLKNWIFCIWPNIGPYDHTTYQKAVCLWPKPYTWQHWFYCDNF